MSVCLQDQGIKFDQVQLAFPAGVRKAYVLVFDEIIMLLSADHQGAEAGCVFVSTSIVKSRRWLEDALWCPSDFVTDEAFCWMLEFSGDPALIVSLRASVAFGT